MPSLLVVTYESSTGQYYFQKVGSAQISDAAITSALIASGAVGWPHIANNAILSAQLGSGIVGAIHVFPFTSGQVILGQGSGYTPVYGGVPAGTPADGSVTSSKIASGQVGDAHIYPASILSAKIAANIIATPHIANQGLLSSVFGANVIATPHIANQGILSASFGANVIGGTHVVNQGLISANFAAGSIGDGHIADQGIVSGKYADQSITEGALVSGISIDIAEMSIEPSYRAQVPISGFLAIQFIVSGYYGFAQAANVSSIPAIGLTTAYVNSGQIGAFQYAGRITTADWNFSGYIGNLVFTGTSSEVTLMVSGLMISGRCVQRFGKVAGVSTIHLKPDLVFAQIAE